MQIHKKRPNPSETVNKVNKNKPLSQYEVPSVTNEDSTLEKFRAQVTSRISQRQKELGWNVDRVAKSFNMSRSSFYKHFKEKNLACITGFAEFCFASDTNPNWIVLGLEPKEMSKIKQSQ